MAKSGVVGTTSVSVSDGAYTLQINWSSTYAAATNTSTITIQPKIARTANFGNSSIRGYGYGLGTSGGVYLNGSQIYKLDTSYGGTYKNLSATGSATAQNFSPTSGTWSPSNSVTLTHGNDGKVSCSTRVYVTVFPYNYSPSSYSQYRKTMDTKTVNINITEERQLKITYNANGGSNPPVDTYFYGTTEDIILSPSIPIRSGYNFVGWATSDSATQKEYDPSQNIGRRASSLTLYAVWKAAGSVHIDKGNEFGQYLIYIDNGNEFKQYVPYIDNGTEWKIYT